MNDRYSSPFVPAEWIAAHTAARLRLRDRWPAVARTRGAP
jgi:hypothetical protein